MLKGATVRSSGSVYCLHDFFATLPNYRDPCYLALYPLVHIVKKKSLALVTIIFNLILPIGGFTQHESSAFLEVDPGDGSVLKLTLSELLKVNATEIKATDKDGAEHSFRGVRLSDILTMSGVPHGTQLRGKNLIKYVLVRAKDGYEVVFSLPEVDPEFTDAIVLLAYENDHRLLSAQDGPFRLVVPEDKKHARWVRQISSIKILSEKPR